MRDMTNQWERFRETVTAAAQPSPEPENAAPAAASAAAAPEAVEPVRHDDLITRIRELLAKYPEIGSRQLYDLALRMHPDIEQGGWRSFHARYVLPLKRERARAEGRMPKRRERKPVEKAVRKPAGAPAKTAAPARKEPSAADVEAKRARVRRVLMQLARQIAVAESRADLVDALSRVEQMVDQVMLAVQLDDEETQSQSEE